MSRKDFELIANALNMAGWVKSAGRLVRPKNHKTYCVCVASALAITNPRFDRTRFLSACGVEEPKK